MASGSSVVVVSQQAQEDVDQIVSFLEEARSIEAAIEFIDVYFHKLDLIESMPGIGKRSGNVPTVRRFPVDRYNVIYYEETGVQVIILRVIDTRRNPADNLFDS